MRKHLILNLVGATRKLLSSGNMPHLASFAAEMGGAKTWRPNLPAVTASVQADLLTNTTAGEHGIVGNGWYSREYAELKMWPQSANLIEAPTVFERWREQNPGSSSAQLFWWWNLPSRADLSVTPRPTYWADGRKGADVHSNPPQLRLRLHQRLGQFPLFNFWGPGANIKSTRWIVDASLDILKEEKPGLCLSYLPHLDYDLQRFGPNSEQGHKAASELDVEFARLLEFANANEYALTVLSEYGIEEVSSAIFPNRTLRDAGLLQIHPAENGSLLDYGNSTAFAVCDHQCAHVYVNEPSNVNQVATLLGQLSGVDEVLHHEQLQEAGLQHSRSGDLFLVAKSGHWFAYPYWHEHELAPDFASGVDIHRKTGYDPCELFINPDIRFPKLKIAQKLLAKKLGLRSYMDLIGLDTTMVKGSHGRPPSSEDVAPIFVGPDDCPINPLS